MGVGLAMVMIVGAIVGTQVYVQKQIDRRTEIGRQDEAFLKLMGQLANLPETAVKERQTIYLALGRLQDDRASTFLVDALAQENKEQVIQALVQAIVNDGLDILPEIKALNFQLRQQLQSIGGNNIQEIKSLKLRLNGTKQAIVQILQLHHQQIDTPLSLDKIDLNGDETGQDNYAPNLNQLDLASVSLKGTLISQGNFQQSVFFRQHNNEIQTTDLSGADLKDGDFTEANLTQVNLSLTNLMRTQFYQASLKGANLEKANLSGAKLVMAQLQNTNFQGAKLTGAMVNQADFTDADLGQASLEQVTAIATNFTQANLTQVNSRNSDFNQANFSKANLQGSNFTNSNFSFANLSKTNLKDADLSNVDLSKADLTGANLDGTDFRNVMFAKSRTDQSSDPASSFVVYPLSEDQAQIKGVNFNKVLNLDTRQLQFICAQGGIHSQCQD
ncbi:MAG: hypothetical protein HC796_07260 [Synechococcaceae cyanobacterium RL_1_2]|nr:hypothetical protein [Synechococcaceae cyanobacterium RL_1_2]